MNNSKFFEREINLIQSEDYRMFVKWYLDNEQWLENITSGDYEKYYEEMYKGR